MQVRLICNKGAKKILLLSLLFSLTGPAEATNFKPVAIWLEIMLLTDLVLQVLYASIAEFNHLAIVKASQMVVVSVSYNILVVAVSFSGDDLL